METRPLIAGRYKFISELGRGGMGLVALAYDERLDTQVALKILRRELSNDIGDKNLLIKEARVLAKLTHPCIVRLYDLAETEIGLMLILEYVSGPNLAQVIQKRLQFTIPELLHVMRQVCDGLSMAHAEGVIHRDLKPANILVAAGSTEISGPEFLLNSRVKITDFGISKILASKLQTTNSPAPDYTRTSASGTPIFMAPEQFQGMPSSPATDIYALGIITYIVLAGHAPFISTDMNELERQHLEAKAAPIGECSNEINAVIQRALAKHPAERFQSAAEFLQALESACNPVVAPPRVPVIETAKFKPKGIDRPVGLPALKWWTVVFLIFGIVVLSGFWIAYSHRSSSGSSKLAMQRLSPGKMIRLPLDVDPAKVIKQLPAPIMGQPLSKRAGPQKTPHARWTAFFDGDVENPSIAGVAPDGTVFIRFVQEVSEGALWAVKDSALKWGIGPIKLESFAHLTWPTKPLNFEDRGRLWLTACEQDLKVVCSGYVFNESGEGGYYTPVPQSIRASTSGDSDSLDMFSQDDAQNGHWPPYEHPLLHFNSRLGNTTLKVLDGVTTVHLDGLPKKAQKAGGKFYITTDRDTVYCIGTSGTLQWTYAYAGQLGAMKALPSGLVLLSDEKGMSVMAIRDGARVWNFSTPASILSLGVADSNGDIYLLAGGVDSVIYALSSEGNRLWDLTYQGSYLDKLYLDDFGSLYLTTELELAGKTRKAIVCLTE